MLAAYSDLQGLACHQGNRQAAGRPADGAGHLRPWLRALGRSQCPQQAISSRMPAPCPSPDATPTGQLRTTRIPATDTLRINRATNRAEHACGYAIARQPMSGAGPLAAPRHAHGGRPRRQSGRLSHKTSRAGAGKARKCCPPVLLPRSRHRRHQGRATVPQSPPYSA